MQQHSIFRHVARAMKPFKIPHATKAVQCLTTYGRTCHEVLRQIGLVHGGISDLEINWCLGIICHSRIIGRRWYDFVKSLITSRDCMKGIYIACGRQLGCIGRLCSLGSFCNLKWRKPKGTLKGWGRRRWVGEAMCPQDVAYAFIDKLFFFLRLSL